jgi:hypothetical protein
MARSTLAELLLLQRHPAEARPLLEQSYPVLRTSLGEDASLTRHVHELLERANAAEE